MSPAGHVSRMWTGTFADRHSALANQPLLDGRMRLKSCLEIVAYGAMFTSDVCRTASGLWRGECVGEE